MESKNSDVSHHSGVELAKKARKKSNSEMRKTKKKRKRPKTQKNKKEPEIEKEKSSRTMSSASNRSLEIGSLDDSSIPRSNGSLEESHKPSRRMMRQSSENSLGNTLRMKGISMGDDGNSTAKFKVKNPGGKLTLRSLYQVREMMKYCLISFFNCRIH